MIEFLVGLVLKTADKIHLHFGIKRRCGQLFHKFLSINPAVFPNKPISQLKIKARILGIIYKLRKQKERKSLGYLQTYPHQLAIDLYKKILPFNPNNLGNWSIKAIRPFQETGLVERELIWKMTDLYQANRNQIEGYVTSGGTEANIFSAWLGRKFLEKKGVKRDEICLLKTSLTHYSVEKAADIIGSKTLIVPLNKKTWGMDRESFQRKIEELTERGYRGFLVALTLGYTVTGTVDPYEEICKTIRIFKSEIKVEFFVWLDAALNGLIEPFLNKEFKPFALPEIQTFLVDFHKFGFVPIPAGIVLYRKNLRKLIEKPIPYLEQKDNILLGSRSGAAPVACWAVIHNLGKSGFRRLILERKKEMDKFLQKFKNKKELEFIVYPKSLSCGIIIKDKSFNLKKFEREYGLNFRKTQVMFTDKTKDFLISKAFFLN